MKFKMGTNRVFRLSLLVLILILLGGCAKKLLYSNIDWVVIEYLDNYVSLDGEQESLLEERVLLLADWHKSEELPNYISHLKELENLQEKDITLEALEQNREKMRAHYERLVTKAAPELFSLSMLLTEKQEKEFLDNVQERYQERNEKYMDKSDEEIRGIIFENTEEWMEDWIGSITKEQKARAKLLAGQVVINSEYWRDYRSTIHQELVVLFDNKSNNMLYQQSFMQLLFEPDSYYSEQLSKNVEQNIRLTDQFTVEIAQSMSDKQWRHFRHKVREWRVLAEELAN